MQTHSPLGQAWLGFLLPVLLEWGHLTSHFVRCTRISGGVKKHLGVWSPSRWLERQSWASEVDALASSGPQGHSFPQSIPQLPARKRGDRAAEIETHLKDSSRFSLKLRSCTETGASRGSGARMQTSLVLRSSVTSGPKSVTGKLVKPTQSQLS